MRLALTPPQSGWAMSTLIAVLCCYNSGMSSKLTLLIAHTSLVPGLAEGLRMRLCPPESLLFASLAMWDQTLVLKCYLHPMCSKYATTQPAHTVKQMWCKQTHSWVCDTLNKRMNSLNEWMNGWMGWMDEWLDERTKDEGMNDWIYGWRMDR